MADVYIGFMETGDAWVVSHETDALVVIEDFLGHAVPLSFTTDADCARRIAAECTAAGIEVLMTEMAAFTATPRQNQLAA